MSSFFTLPASQRKRKRTEDRPGKPAKRRGVQATNDDDVPLEKESRKSKRAQRDESISGSESEEDVQSDIGSESEATSEEDETAAERRVRLAQRYLDNIREEVDEIGFDAEEVDKDLIAARLKEDVDEAKGRQYRLIATALDFSRAIRRNFKAATQSTTAVAVCPPFAYTVSKDKTLTKWKLPTLQSPNSVDGSSTKLSLQTLSRPKKVHSVKGIRKNKSTTQYHGHIDPILSLAASPDGKYIATGGADKRLVIWSASNLMPLKTFSTHRDAVTSLSFAPLSPSSSSASTAPQLFSASLDRTLKTYSLNSPESLAYIETLFGHQDHVLGVAALGPDTCVSVGARDRTARLWKVIDETQLVFRADSSRHEEYKTGSVDCVASLPPAHFVTGSDSGAIALWSIHKKKPLHVVQAGHGVEAPIRLEDVSSECDPEVLKRLKLADTRRPQARAITALASVPGTDIVLSGSWDGWVRVWRMSGDKRSLHPLGVVGTSGEKEEEEEKKSPQQMQNGHDDILMQNGGESESIAMESVKEKAGPLPGVVNSIAVFERRSEVRNEFGLLRKEGGVGEKTLGLCIVVGMGREMRLGRWRRFEGAQNGAVMFEVPAITNT